MPEGEGTPGQGAGEGQGNEGKPNEGKPAPSATAVLGPDGKPLDPARAAAAIERLRVLPAELSKKDQTIAELQAKVKEHDDAKLSETELLSKRNAELEAEKIAWEIERQSHVVGNAVREAASKAGATYPDAVYKLIDHASLEFDAEGKPKGLDKVIEGLKKEYPGMFGKAAPGSGDGGARRNQGQGSNAEMNDLIRERLGRL